ncbi:MAG: TatD family hydrolase [Clostridia bacterium]|nr:TatD family hydrolase [Clostridia bacterium]
MLFDTHAHLNDERFDNLRDELITSLAENGVGAYCEIGYDIESSKKAIELSEKYDLIYAAAGVHPHDTDPLTEKDMETLKSLCSHKNVVALGEIGLDYYYDNSKRENQRKWFDRQLSLAEEIDIPVTIHTRDAMADTIDILKAHKEAKGIIHCYSGSVESAKILLGLGYYISFAGPLTFKNASTALEVAKYVPKDRMLIETDSPYLAPVPYRGKTNTPIYVAEVAKRLAEIKEMTFDDVCRITFENAKKVYRIA